MADWINEAKYTAMMDELQKFSKLLYKLCEGMDVAGRRVETVFNEDSSKEEIMKTVRGWKLIYGSFAMRADEICKLMQQELDGAKRERDIWNNDH